MQGLLAVLCCAVAVVGVFGVLPRPRECIVQSRRPDGRPAMCGGFVGERCPNPTDTCQYYPGSDYGPCCLGCPVGRPLQGSRCGGFVGRPCPRGYTCITDPFIADGEGICCRGGLQGYPGSS